MGRPPFEAFAALVLMLLPAMNAAVPAARADDDPPPPACRIEDTQALLRTKIEEQPNFFFRVFPKSKLLGFSTGDNNRLLELDTGKVHVIPGTFDPVCAGEDVITIPAITPPGATEPQKTLSIYSTRALLAAKADEVPKLPSLAELKISGTYQSIGVRKIEGRTTTFRVLTDEASSSVLDFKVTTVEGGDPIVEPLTGAHQICPYVDFKLPMLSRNGTEVSGVDTDGITKIWEIGADGDSCVEKRGPGFATGKADFSADGSKLAFHIPAKGVDLGEKPDEYAGAPDNDSLLNVYVYDRKTGAVSQLTHNQSGNSYYPSWRDDGTLVYVDVNSRHQASYVLADPRDAPEIAAVSSLGAPAPCSKPDARQILGEAWFQLCASAAKVNAMPAILTALSLDPDRCKEIVEEFLKRHRPAAAADADAVSAAKVADFDKSFPRDVMLAACPKQAPRKRAEAETEVGSYGLAQAKPRTGLEVGQRRCALCHGRAFDFEHPEKIPNELLNKMLNRIRTEKMPPDLKLGLEEQELLISHLSQGLKKE